VALDVLAGLAFRGQIQQSSLVLDDGICVGDGARRGVHHFPGGGLIAGTATYIDLMAAMAAGMVIWVDGWFWVWAGTSGHGLRVG